LPVIVDSQHKTSSTTICTLPRLLPQNHSPAVHLGKQHYPRTCQGASTRDDAEEGGLHVSRQSFIISKGPLPLHPIPQLQISTGSSTNTLWEQFSKIYRPGATIRRLHKHAPFVRLFSGLMSVMGIFRQLSVVFCRDYQYPHHKRTGYAPVGDRVPVADHAGSKPRFT